MLRSLYSGVSGMRGFQTKMDVIANNIANVNTTAFKSGRARFQDMISQTIANAQGPSTTVGGLGGVNPQQAGLGVRVGAIDTVMTGGALQPTNRDLDFAIEGDGFFAVSPKTGTTYYTRDGAFFRDYEGNLVNSNGEKVMGYKGTAVTGTLEPLKIEELNGGNKLDSFSIDGTGKISALYGTSKVDVGTIAIVKFSNPEGLEKVGNNNYIKTNNSGDPENGVAGGTGFGVIRQGFLEMSNVDLANEFTEMIIASRAYQANSRSITTSDEMIQELLNLKR